MKYWGAAIPGLTMNAKDLPEIPGLLRLDNPEVGTGERIGKFYSLENAALCHLKTLQSHKGELEDDFTLMGMSMGGMILSVLASKHRSDLPERCRFRFMVTSPNQKELPALPARNLLAWLTILPRTPKKMERLLTHLFGPAYQKKHPEKLKAYFSMMAHGENEQSLPALVRQIHALRHFQGSDYFAKVNPEEALFIGGANDTVLGPRHSRELKKLAPHAKHQELPGIGHMVHLEAPEIFARDYKPH